MDQKERQHGSRTAVPGALGGLLLVLWLAAMIGGFAALQPRLHAAPEASVRDVERHLSSLAAPAPSAEATAYLLADCRCPGQQSADLAELRTHLEDAGFALHALPASAFPLPYPLIVVGRDARLLYAGPPGWGPGCGGRDLMPPLLHALATTERPPLVIDSNCSCS